MILRDLLCLKNGDREGEKMDINNQLAISIRGASHFASGKPVQDYSLAVKGEDFSIAVVCDGHGHDKHFRSEKGSELAALVTKNKLMEFFEHNNTWEIFNDNTEKKLSHLKLSIITAWQICIENYTKQNPFTEEELKKASSSFASRKDYDVAQPYGTTILAALVCKEYYLVLMIGDGAISKIKSDYSASIVTFPGKKVFDDQPHSATDSLCEQDAYKKIYFSYEQIKDEIFAFGLCSDGMSEAFATDDILLAKINNYLNYYAEEGLDKATTAIEAQLNELSKISSMKDDISLAFATLYLEKFDKSKQVIPTIVSSANETTENENSTPSSTTQVDVESGTGDSSTDVTSADNKLEDGKSGKVDANINAEQSSVDNTDNEDNSAS